MTSKLEYYNNSVASKNIYGRKHNEFEVIGSFVMFNKMEDVDSIHELYEYENSCWRKFCCKKYSP
jgi:hypothetical protein